MVQLMLCKCIRISLEVRAIVLRSLSYLCNLVAEFNSGNRGHLIKWSATNYSNIIYHSVKLQTQVVFNEIRNQAEWGTLYYAMESVSDCYMFTCRINRRSVIQGNDVTYKIAAATNSRAFFVANGTLDNQVETRFRGISDAFPVFAIARDLGSIQETQAPVVWTIGLTTDPATSYSDLSGAPATGRSPYYKSQYSDDGSLVSGGISLGDGVVAKTNIQIVDYLNDFSNASLTAQQLDQKILQDAASVHDLLGDLISLSLPQVYGNIQLTIGTDSHGNFNKSDVMMFMKNLGGANPG